MFWRKRKRRPRRKLEKHEESEPESLLGSSFPSVGGTKHVSISPQEGEEPANSLCARLLAVPRFPIKVERIMDPKLRTMDGHMTSGFESCLTSTMAYVVSEAMKEGEQELEVLDWNGIQVRKKNIINVL